MMYLYGAIAIVMALLVAAVAVERSQATSARAQRDMARAALSVAEAVNKANLKTIAEQKHQAEEDDKLTADLISRLSGAAAALQNANAELADLRDKDENVRSYLDAPVPDAVQRVLNH